MFLINRCHPDEYDGVGSPGSGTAIGRRRTQWRLASSPHQSGTGLRLGLVRRLGIGLRLRLEFGHSAVLSHIQGHVRRKQSASSDSEDDISGLIVRSQPLRPARSKPQPPRQRPYCQKCGFICACSKGPPPQRIKCVDCYADCGTVHEYVSHKRQSHPTERYKCHQCPKAYLRMENFANHMRTHEGNLQCMFCDYNAPNEIRLKAHVRTHSHPNAKRNGVNRQPMLDTYFYCPLCHVRSSNYNYVVSHCHRHVLTRPYDCRKCGKRFHNAGDLSDHYVNHIDEDSITCGTCSKAFNNSEQLRVHRITFHGETRVFACVTCGTKFDRMADLESHQLTHQEKPFMCDLCGRDFNQLSNLKTHKLSNHGTE
ncbi:unnamed protein product [Nesidiocoris tenuis]|uniref:C2H2-type domain-containing protein n=1 Tax=Nesidiocoris tenuis TaxID=355587 RepID=A0A6H5H028_9HEMI|nr:unnamed protein product [Nesidiocoris tenuis]